MPTKRVCPFLRPGACADSARVTVVGVDVGTVRCGIAVFEATVHLSPPARAPPALPVDPDTGELLGCTCVPRAHAEASRPGQAHAHRSHAALESASSLRSHCARGHWPWHWHVRACRHALGHARAFGPSVVGSVAASKQ